jgi:UDP-N-acetylmuramate dehydrogenase
MKIRENVKISELTTMRLGGAAKYVIDIETPDDLTAAYAFANDKGLSTYILGGGSNLIGKDEGFDGVILVDRLRGMEDLGGGRFKGFGGEVLDDFIAFTVKNGYSGMEAMSAIPGTLGAAPVQNVGAYGQDLSGVLESAEAYDTQTQSGVFFTTQEVGLSYRRSIFNYGSKAGRYFIVSVTVKLKKGELKPPFYTSLQQYIDEHKTTDFSPSSIRRIVTEIRANKLPDPKKEASAGSFFKNVYLRPKDTKVAEAKGIPVWDGGKIPAGWLIEHAGLKGKEFYGFRISDKAALILINESATGYADLVKARQAISKAVQEKFGFTLEQEPVEIGDR